MSAGRVAAGRASLWLALFCCGALSACASIPPDVGELDAGATAVELRETPFYPQERYQCGPAALLTILEASGAPADLDVLVDRVYLPGRKGSLQAELIAATRAEGRVPYRVDGEASALLAELAAGRPVLVLQNLGIELVPRWHYAVVVGIDPEAGEVVLRSGTERRRVTALRTFLHTWRRSDYWGFVALEPGEFPARVRAERYFAALAALEETGRAAAAKRGWQAAIERWPDSRIALFGLGNSELALGNARAAEAVYRRLLEDAPGLPIVRNNLALSLKDQGRQAEARAEALAALEDASSNPELSAEIRRTLEELE